MRIPILLTVVLLMSFVSLVKAQPNIKISTAEEPKWLKPIKEKPKEINLDEISLGYYFELAETQYNLQNQTHFVKHIKVISDESGAENAGQVSVNFDPIFERLVIHKLQIERDGKLLNRLDLSKFKTVAVESELSRMLYNGEYSSFTVIDDIRKGDKIIFSYSKIGFNPVFEGKFANTYYLEGIEPTGLVHLVYAMPHDRKLNVKTRNGAKSAKRLVKDDLTYFYWEGPMDAAISSDDNYIPNWYDNTACVQVSEYSTWYQVAEWAKRVNPIAEIKAGSPLDLQVQQLWEEADQDTVKYFDKAVSFVQNSIRYMGIEMGENSHRAHPVEKVFNQRYGDCKDKSLLLASMLARKGIKSSLILANTYQDKELDQLQPSPLAFNHMVLAAVVKGRMNPVDPTMSNQGGNIDTRYFPYYGKVLFLENGRKLNEVSKPMPSHGNYVKVEDIIQLLPDGKANLKVITQFYDQEADYMRNYFKENAKNQIQEEYVNFYNKLYNKAKSLKPFTYADDINKNVLTVTEEYFLEKYTQEEGRKVAPAFAKYILDRIPEVEEERVSPIAVEYPLSIEHIVKIINRDNKDIGDTPIEETVIERDGYWYSRSGRIDKDTLIFSNVFRFNDTFIPTNQVQQYISDYKEISDYLTYAVYLNNDGYMQYGYDLNIKFKFSGWALLVFLILSSFVGWILFGVYNNSRPGNLVELNSEQPYHSIDGLLILFALYVGTGPFEILSRQVFVDNSPLSANMWNKSEVIASHQGNTTVYYLFMVWWLIYISIALVGTVYVLILFLKRRDIFPQTMIYMEAFQLFFIMTTIISANSAYPNKFSLSTLLNNYDAWAILLSLLSITYIYISQRVKQTFIVPYSEKSDDISDFFHHLENQKKVEEHKEQVVVVQEEINHQDEGFRDDNDLKNE